VTNGLIPACVKTCPAGALSWGDRAEMIAKAKARVEALKNGRGFPNANLYGETELGGLGRLYILTERPSAHGLPEKPQYPAMATVWQDVVQPLGEIAIGATALGLLLNFLVVRRRIKVEEED